LLLPGSSNKSIISLHPEHPFRAAAANPPDLQSFRWRHPMRAVGALLALTFVLAIPAFSQSENQKSSPPQRTAASTGALAVQADVAGTLFIDGQRRSAIVASKIAVLNLMPGQHIVELRDTKGNILWKDTVTIPKGEQVVQRISAGAVNDKSATAPGPGTHRKLLEEYLASSANTDSINSKSKKEELVQQLDDCKTHYRSKEEMIARMALNQEPTRADCWDGRMAEALYPVGRYDEALSYINKQIDSQTSFGRDLGFPICDLNHIVTPTSLSGDADAYRLRARIKHALWDERGALSDIDTALKCEVNWGIFIRERAKKQENPKETTKEVELLALGEKRTRLYRAIVLMNLRRYEEAMVEVNEAAGLQGAPLPDTAAIRREILSAMASDPGIPAPSDSIASQNPGVATEIDAVLKSGRYSSLPPAQSIGSAGTGQPSLSIENRTAYELTVLMAGPVEKSLVIPAGSSQNVLVPPGSYRILGRVKAASVLPFFGTQDYANGGAYRESFYIK
jgi:hypothetical protein